MTDRSDIDAVVWGCWGVGDGFNGATKAGARLTHHRDVVLGGDAFCLYIRRDGGEYVGDLTIGRDEATALRDALTAMLERGK